MKKQPVYAGDKLFPTITKLAEWLGVSKNSIHQAFGDKKTVFYKGITLKKAPQEESHPYRPLGTQKGKKPIPVLVDGIAYNNCNEAERAQGWSPNTLIKALKTGKAFYKGKKIEFLYPSDGDKYKLCWDNKRTDNKCVGVYCENLNKHFASIKEAAKFAGADGWTMSKKMETAGKFIDEKGNTYVREKPMKTINVYNNTGAKIRHKVIKPYTRTIKVLDKEPESLQNEVPQIVKDAINDKIKELFKNSELRDQITDLMRHAGFKKIIFTLDEIENN